MEELICQIFHSESHKTVDSISEITGLGVVNKVYDVVYLNNNYIVRINTNRNKEFEFWKEKWCIEKATSLNIPSPEIMKIGLIHHLPFMVMNKVKGSNGSKCSRDNQLSIWRSLGEYASKFHNVKQIDELQVTTDEFHPNWKSKLEYNINQLNSNDSLLSRNVFKKEEHELCQKLLRRLQNKRFTQGLVHGDLCPRNTIFQNETVTLLDWGSSKIDIVPHTEIGIIETDNNLSSTEFEAFLDGYKLSESEYANIKNEICQINLLNSLDLYRWAEGSDFSEIDQYSIKLRRAFEKAIKY